MITLSSPTRHMTPHKNDAVGATELVFMYADTHLHFEERRLDRLLHLVGEVQWSTGLIGEYLESPLFVFREPAVDRLATHFELHRDVGDGEPVPDHHGHRIAALFQLADSFWHWSPSLTSQVDAKGGGNVKDQPLPCRASGVTESQISRFPFVTNKPR